MARIDTINRAVEFSGKIPHIFIATTDNDRVPHMAAAGPLELQSPDRIVVTAWFCPGTIGNLAGNKSIAIVIWESTNDTGYQIIGKVKRITENAILNGYAPDIEKSRVYPQIRHQLVVQVDQVLIFTVAPHGDVEA